MENKVVRPPVVVVLGHVDHGKTTLLDSLRSASVAEGEFGKITQHIGAYELITKENKKITFVDTPGHEAFNSLRSRGASVADIALLIVAADDSVQPQTIEALKQIRAYKIPFIVVINKIDLENAMPEKVIKDLMKHEVHLEGRGGEVPMVQISAMNKLNLEGLLELISLLADLNNLTYEASAPVQGVVVEAKKDRRGVVLSLILHNGHLKIGQTVYLGEEEVKVRALFNDRGENINEVFPSTPFELLGSKLIVAPGTIMGEQFVSKEVVSQKASRSGITSDEYFAADQKKFNFIIKGDAFGTLEAIGEKFKEFEEIKIIKSETGELTEADLELAKTTKANILIFNTKLKGSIKEKAEKEEINIFEYTLIYELLDQVEDLIFALRVKQQKEASKVGEAKVFGKLVKDGKTIAGLRVISGRINIQDKVELVRGKKILGETTISSLFQKSTPVQEVKKGEECGAVFATKLDFQQADSVKLYKP